MNFNAATYNAIIIFNSASKAGKGFGLFNQWIKKALYGTLLKKEGENGEYSIYGLNYQDGKNYVTFNVESDSSENIYWQLNNVKNFVKTLSGALEFHANVLIVSEKVVWFVGEK
jgi:hypothetical protein